MDISRLLNDESPSTANVHRPYFGGYCRPTPQGQIGTPEHRDLQAGSRHFLTPGTALPGQAPSGLAQPLPTRSSPITIRAVGPITEPHMSSRAFPHPDLARPERPASRIYRHPPPLAQHLHIPVGVTNGQVTHLPPRPDQPRPHLDSNRAPDRTGFPLLNLADYNLWDDDDALKYSLEYSRMARIEDPETRRLHFLSWCERLPAPEQVRFPNCGAIWHQCPPTQRSRGLSSAGVRGVVRGCPVVDRTSGLGDRGVVDERMAGQSQE